MTNKKIPALFIYNLCVAIEGKEIVKGVSMEIKPGELNVVMGPNGSGKSTLTYALMGHPSYQIPNPKSQFPNKKKSEIKIGRKSLLDLEPHERAELGVMLGFQNPVAVPGVTLTNFLRTAYTELYGSKDMTVVEFHNYVKEHAKRLQLKPEFLRRAINDGFSGGEKKKAEMLQLLVLKPKFVILDEIDTGLDVDALKAVAAGIKQLKNSKSGLLLITHYQRILNYIKPDVVHVMQDGTIVKTGGIELVRTIEEKGYAAV